MGNKNYTVLTLLGRHSLKKKKKLCWEEKRGMWATKFWIYEFNKLYTLDRKDLKSWATSSKMWAKLILLSKRF